MIGAELITIDLLWAAAAALAAGLLFGFTGFGAALVMAPLFTLLWDARIAVGMSMILIAVASAQVLPSALKLCDRRQMALMGASACVTIPIGGWVLVSLDLELMRRIIGIVVVLITVALATGWRYPGVRQPGVTAAVGALSGILNGATSMGGPPAIFYLLSGPDRAEVSRANLIAFFAIMNVAGIITLIVAGVINWETTIRAGAGAPAILIGIAAGSWAFKRAADTTYRRVAIGILFIVGVAALVG
ncbi:MAG: sulfite exporter TauE/SafE family protein [Proteobacteria bacterium]|nr:sulfite exporter TauE/SafE family protein [Pseudomonadota bacterium]